MKTHTHGKIIVPPLQLSKLDSPRDAYENNDAYENSDLPVHESIRLHAKFPADENSYADESIRFHAKSPLVILAATQYTHALDIKGTSDSKSDQDQAPGSGGFIMQKINNARKARVNIFNFFNV